MPNQKKSLRAFEQVLGSTNKNIDIDKIPMNNAAIQKLMTQAKNNNYSSNRKKSSVRGLAMLNPKKGKLGIGVTPKPLSS